MSKKSFSLENKARAAQHFFFLQYQIIKFKPISSIPTNGTSYNYVYQRDVTEE
jgi:hypothetical protein